MANSYIEYNQNLSETTYSVPFNVLSIDDVNAKGYNGTTWSDLTVASRDATAKTITLDTAPSAVDKIRVWRNTGTSQLVDFQNGSRLSESDLDTAYQQGLFVAQEVSENASTEIEGIGPQGPQGIQGVAGNDGADGADGVDGTSSTVALSESFESSEQTITVGNIAINHNLGGIPKLFQVVLKCDNAANIHGYSVGDEVDITSGSIAGDTMSCFSNSTQVGAGIGGTGVFRVLHKDAASYNDINASHWKLVFRAFA